MYPINDRQYLKICKKNDADKLSSSIILDKLMETLDGEDNFLTED